MLEKAEKLYTALKEKYKQLPNFKELDFEFELSGIKEESLNSTYFSRTIRRRMYEKMYYFNSALVTIIAPQAPTLILAHESKFITNEDRDEIMKLIKKLTKTERAHLILETEFDERGDIEFIKKALEIWKETKPAIKRILEIMRDSWEKKDSFKTGDYFG